ncbi:hypothetical protein GOP47_0006976 [Adiantum capillus-veneris]|uniref:Uncharacterized protein n=1 Tax=Adiantum capillus-veneris TaxID=13818 RepID=A0A9D4ZKG5_ADICA|nr:hypothetical protein GOP47_0006976 [Adiantum capillus-veneris]
MRPSLMVDNVQGTEKGGIRQARLYTQTVFKQGPYYITLALFLLNVTEEEQRGQENQRSLFDKRRLKRHCAS